MLSQNCYCCIDQSFCHFCSEHTCSYDPEIDDVLHCLDWVLSCAVIASKLYWLVRCIFKYEISHNKASYIFLLSHCWMSRMVSGKNRACIDHCHILCVESETARWWKKKMVLLILNKVFDWRSFGVVLLQINVFAILMEHFIIQLKHCTTTQSHVYS